MKQAHIPTFVFLSAVLLAIEISFSSVTIAAEPAQQPELKQLLLKAKAMSFSGQPTAAIPVYKRVIAQDPHNSQAYSGLGWVSYQLGKIDESINYQRKAIQLDPLSAEPHYYLAAIYMSRKQYQSAESEHKLANELSKNRPCNCGHSIQLLNTIKTQTTPLSK